MRRLLFDAGDDLDDLMNLCKSDITSKNKEKKIKYLKRFETVTEKLVDLEDRDKIKLAASNRWKRNYVNI